jgi:hypothetical protein
MRGAEAVSSRRQERAVVESCRGAARAEHPAARTRSLVPRGTSGKTLIYTIPRSLGATCGRCASPVPADVPRMSSSVNQLLEQALQFVLGSEVDLDSSPSAPASDPDTGPKGEFQLLLGRPRIGV